MSEQEKSGGAISLTPQLEDVLKRICSNSKVEGVVVVNNEGIPIKSTLDSTSTVQVGGMGGPQARLMTDISSTLLRSPSLPRGRSVL